MIAVVYKVCYKQVEVVMTKRTSKKPKSKKDLEIKFDPQKLASESEFATISLPATFPFQDLTCLDEYKKLFENLFNGTK